MPLSPYTEREIRDFTVSLIEDTKTSDLALM